MDEIVPPFLHATAQPKERSDIAAAEGVDLIHRSATRVKVVFEAVIISRSQRKKVNLQSCRIRRPDERTSLRLLLGGFERIREPEHSKGPATDFGSGHCSHATVREIRYEHPQYVHQACRRGLLGSASPASTCNQWPQPWIWGGITQNRGKVSKDGGYGLPGKMPCSAAKCVRSRQVVPPMADPLKGVSHPPGRPQNRRIHGTKRAPIPPELRR